MQDGPGSGQPRDREKRDWSPVPPGYKPAVMQPGTSLGRADQGHTGREDPQSQPSAEPEAQQPPTILKEARVKHGEGEPCHPGSMRRAHEGVSEAATPAYTNGRELQTEAPRTDYCEENIRTTKHPRGTQPPCWKDLSIDAENEKATEKNLQKNRVRERDPPRAGASRVGNPRARPGASRPPRVREPRVATASATQPSPGVRPVAKGKRPRERPRD